MLLLTLPLCKIIFSGAYPKFSLSLLLLSLLPDCLPRTLQIHELLLLAERLFAG